VDTESTPGEEKALVVRQPWALEPARLSLVPTAPPPTPTPPAPPPPPPAPPPPPPKPAYVPPTPRWSPPRRRKSGVGRKVLWVVGGLVGLSILGHLVEPGSSTPASGGTPPSASGTCPSEVAQWLPGKADLVARYQTDKHTVTLCQDSSGQVWYDGRVTGATVTDSTHISLRATRTANGYVANNKGYVYEIRGTQLTATNNGKVVSRSQLKQVSP
jgi:hypothetical protein